MKKTTITFISALMLIGHGAFAEEVNVHEKADTTTVSLAPYSLGLGAGVISALSPKLKDESPAFMKMSVIQSITFMDKWNVGLDLDWLLPGQNWGGELSLDYLFANTALQPFVGAGAGMRYFETGNNFGENIGASGTVHAGVLISVMDELQLRVRVPFHVVMNKEMDMGVGLDLGILFSSPQRTNKVRKLKYQ